MSQIDEIINRYNYYINTSRKETEKLINESLPLIKESFISFYGEKNREVIEKKLSNISIFVSPLQLYNAYNEMKNEIIDALSAKYSDDTISIENMYCSSENQDLLEELKIINEKIKPIREQAEKYRKTYLDMYEITEKETHKKACELIKKELINRMNYSEEEANLYLEKINGTSLGLEFFWQFEVFFGEINNFNTIFNCVGCLRELKIDFPDLICEKNNNFGEGYTNLDLEKDKQMLLSILENEEVKKIILNKETINKILEILNYKRNLISSISDIKAAETFYSENIISQNILGFDERVTSSHESGYAGLCSPRLISTNNGVEIYNTININPYVFPIECLGKTLIHEINHAIESSFSYTPRGTYMIKSGWDIACEKTIGSNVSVGERNQYRESQLLNEVINEKISLEIYNKIKENSSNPLFSQYIPTSYNNAFFIIEEFYNNYKDIIIESRQKNDMQILYDYMGKDNLIQLENLFIYFSKYFYENDFEYEKALNDYQNGIENENTTVLLNCIKQKEIILNNIESYRNPRGRSKGNINMNIIGFVILIISFLFIILKFM